VSDGINHGFIKEFYDILKEELLHFLSTFIESKLKKAINSTVIVLILKIESPRRLAGFLLISLVGCLYVGCLYKIMSKVLANRLREVDGNVVSEHQSTFFKGRQILDGILIAIKIVDDVHSLKKELLLFKFDFDKAYDYVG